jgi:microcystin-dependent protein
VSDPYVGEIRMFCGNFAPNGWLFCDGSLLQIADSETLFNLIGTTYGGDGQTTFAVPNLISRIPIHVGTGFSLGQQAGVESVTLIPSQIPQHSHSARASAQASQTSPAGNVWAAWGDDGFSDSPPDAAMAAAAIAPIGGSQAHENRPPFLALNFIISQFGIFPSS